MTVLVRHAADAPVPGAAPFLLLHGLGGDRHTWRPVVEGLRRDRDVLVAELPGFGTAESLPAGVEPSPGALADDVAATLTVHGVDRAHVVGVSLGGWIALELALRDRALSVLALAPAGFWKSPLKPSSGTTRRIGRAVRPIIGPVTRSRRARTAVLSGAMGGMERIAAGDAAALLRAYLGAPDFTRVDRAMRQRTFGGGPRLAEAAEHAPVQIVWGGKDRLVVPPRAPLPTSVPQHHLAHAGHLPMFDDPAAVVALARSGADAADASPRPQGVR